MPEGSARTDGRTRAVTIVMKESQQISAEHRDLAAHAHRAGAERHGKEDHLPDMKALDKHWSIPIRLTSSANKSMREPGRRRVPKEALTRPASRTSPHTLMDFGKAGECPEGSPERDWFQAVEEVRSGH